jgi:hypothetical protein
MVLSTDNNFSDSFKLFSITKYAAELFPASAGLAQTLLISIPLFSSELFEQAVVKIRIKKSVKYFKKLLIISYLTKLIGV